MSFTLDRRRFGALLGAGVVAGTVGLPLRRAQAADTIYVLNWQGYGTDEAWALKAFTEKTGIDGQARLFQLRRGDADQAADQSRHLRRRADQQRPHAAGPAEGPAGSDRPVQGAECCKDLSPQLRDHANFNKDGKTYGVAWLWGINALGLRRDKVAKPDSLRRAGRSGLCRPRRPVRRRRHRRSPSVRC
jgi:spermidine/putrescine transport system substrate-binding protein